MNHLSVAVMPWLILLGTTVAPADDASDLTDAQIEAYRMVWSAAVDRVTPDGYLYEEPRRCAGCHDTAKDARGNSTHRNAIGVTGDPESPTLTGKGWLSGAHGHSQDSAIAANTFCAWCHAPSQPGVTDRIERAEPVEMNRAGVSCIVCHASEAVNEHFGSYQANFLPGGDRVSLVDFIPRSPASGIETNRQCLFCHLEPHPFAAPTHAKSLDAGALRCIDCHMAVYHVTESGREERYHNMKVAANNDPAACCPCHEFAPDEVAARCADLVPAFSSIVHAVPAFK